MIYSVPKKVKKYRGKIICFEDCLLIHDLLTFNKVSKSRTASNFLHSANIWRKTALQRKYYLEFYLDFFGLRLPNDRAHCACYVLTKRKLLSRLLWDKIFLITLWFLFTWIQFFTSIKFLFKLFKKFYLTGLINGVLNAP